ncbi:methyltransferase domain-containing protein [Pelagicoccus sp. SDUM812005]|uniref:methyltransferase domain-containing protein n=1 Tax=Pelagicoccus sp. SDUM812005 TaxID=3041257 RepID=UPI00280EA2E1|nr:methyltransferase domain-containing protein [Pelagicoccus sp. SDUM812005]MDQ8182795.1 methyltransferase domain-containing protein [Pelagicoccus sp. SDUM812005]
MVRPCELGFGAKAEQYDARAQVQARVAGWTAEWLDPALAGLDALEFGAGTGLFTRYAARLHGRRLWATDVAEPMLEVGRRASLGCRWLEQDAWNPSLEGPFGALYTTSLLQWCPDPLDTLRKWRGLAEAGSRLLGAVFVAGTMREWESCEGALGQVAWRAEADWLVALEGSCWSLVRSEVASWVEYAESAREAARSWHGIGAVVSGGERRVGEFLRSMRRYQREWGGGRGVPCTWRVLRFEAEGR